MGSALTEKEWEAYAKGALRDVVAGVLGRTITIEVVPHNDRQGMSISLNVPAPLGDRLRLLMYKLIDEG